MDAKTLSQPDSAAAPELSPAARRGMAALLFLALLGLYLEGIPNRIANPLHGLGLLSIGALLAGRGSVGPGLGLLVLALAGPLLVGDGILRTTLDHQLYYRPNERFIRRIPAYPFLHRYVPGVDAEVPSLGDLEAMRPPKGPRPRRNLRFRTDHLGFRNDPWGEGTRFRAVLLGDSFVLGAGLPQEDTWAQGLTRDHGRRTYNLAFPANPWQELLLLQTVLDELPLEPGAWVVWSVFTGNDFRGDSGSLTLPEPAPTGRQLKTRLANYRHRSPVRLLLERLFPGKGAFREEGRVHLPPVVPATYPGGELLFYRDYLDAARMTPEQLQGYPSVRAFPEVVRAMQELVTSRGLGLALVVLPTKAEVYPDLLPEGQTPPPRPTAFATIFRDLSRDRGIPFLDLQPGLVEAAAALPDQELLWWPDDTHWNRHGAAAAAKLVAGFLDRLEAVPQ